MSYTGKVTEGGPADVRELSRLMITKMVVGDFGNNTYLLRCRQTDEQLLVDAAAEPDRILSLVGDGGLTKVVTTHQHGDHWGALAEVVEATGATTYAGRHDAEGIPVATDVLVEDGDTITVGDCTLSAIHLVGHTPGLDRAAVRRPRRHPAPLHRRLPLPRRGRATPSAARRTSTPCCTT